MKIFGHPKVIPSHEFEYNINIPIASIHLSEGSLASGPKHKRNMKRQKMVILEVSARGPLSMAKSTLPFDTSLYLLHKRV
jgi:hypothetical protein